MSQLRQTLENENALDEFDRIVFESIVEKVIVGGYDAEGNPTPYKPVSYTHLDVYKRQQYV